MSLAIGFALAASLGVLIGVLMGCYRPAYWALNPYISVFMSAPKAALIPVFVMMIGSGRQAVILGIVLLLVLPGGGERARRCGGDPAFRDRDGEDDGRVAIPGPAPHHPALGGADDAGGLRLASGRAIKGLMIGALVQRYGVTLQVAPLYAMILMIGFAGLIAVVPCS